MMIGGYLFPDIERIPNKIALKSDYSKIKLDWTWFCYFLLKDRSKIWVEYAVLGVEEKHEVETLNVFWVPDI